MPPTLRGRPAAPRALQVSAGLWFASCAAGLFGIMAAVLDGPALERRLIAAAQGDDPAVADGVRMLIALVTAVPTVLVLLTFLGGALLARGRAGGRRLLVVTAPIAVLAAGAAQSVVAGGADLDRAGLVAQAGLLVLALLSLFVRPVRASLPSRQH